MIHQHENIYIYKKLYKILFNWYVFIKRLSKNNHIQQSQQVCLNVSKFKKKVEDILDTKNLVNKSVATMQY